jgi:flagellar biosynthesis protein FlhF
MRLKTYHAPMMSEAMQLVRDQLGPDAIIVATHEDEATRSVRVTAAVERDETEFEQDAGFGAPDLADELSAVLDNHGTPMALSDQVVSTAVHLGISDPTLALAGALDEIFNFAPLTVKHSASPLIFIGPPGAGKTVSVAKLAVRARLAGAKVSLITTDTVRAGAIEQISIYAGRLGLDVQNAATPHEFAQALDRVHKNTQVLVDTMGVNPYNAEDMDRLAGFREVVPMEAVLVLTAGRDALEAAELSVSFHPAAPSRLVVTGLDMARRLGSMLSAAEASSIPFSDVSIAPDIASSLCSLNPVSLARLLLAKNRQDSDTYVTEIFQSTGSR